MADFPPVLTGCSNPESAGAARLSGVSVCPASDTGTALPNHPRYQLRYTRLFSLFIRLVIFSQTTRPAAGDTTAAP
jgi:hypothetical protein